MLNITRKRCTLVKTFLKARRVPRGHQNWMTSLQFCSSAASGPSGVTAWPEADQCLGFVFKGGDMVEPMHYI